MRCVVLFPCTPPWLSDKRLYIPMFGMKEYRLYRSDLSTPQIVTQWLIGGGLPGMSTFNNLNMLTCVPCILLLTGKQNLLPGGMRISAQKVTFTYRSQDVSLWTCPTLT